MGVDTSHLYDLWISLDRNVMSNDASHCLFGISIINFCSRHSLGDRDYTTIDIILTHFFHEFPSRWMVLSQRKQRDNSRNLHLHRFLHTTKISVTMGESSIASKAVGERASLRFTPPRGWCILSVDSRLVKNMK